MWWINKKDVLLDIASKTSNSIVYNKKSIEKSITKLNEIDSIDRLYYAMKANFKFVHDEFNDNESQTNIPELESSKDASDLSDL